MAILRPTDVKLSNSSLASLGFAEVSLATRKALLVCSQALEKRGKTHFALTAPDPIAIISNDTGTEEIAAKFKRQGKQVMLFRSVPTKELNNHDAALKEWDRSLRAWMGVVENKAIRTLIIDTHTEFWANMRLARFGKLEQVPPKKYDEVNRDMRDMVKMIKERQDLNAVFIHKYKKEYVAGPAKADGTKGMDNWSGNYERAGFGDMGFLCDVVIEHEFAYPTKPGKRAIRLPEGISEKDFYLRVMDTRYEMQAIVGEVLGSEQCNFLELVNLALPDADLSNWL